MQVLTATVLACGVLGAVAGCGSEPEAPIALPPTGTAYRALSGPQRLAVAASCRDRAAAKAGEAAADELGEVDARALRAELDSAFTWRANQRRSVAKVCAETVPLVTPGWRFTFDGAKDVGYEFSYETDSDKPLTIRGAISPAPDGGHVVARREFGGSRAYRGEIGHDGRFALPTIRLRKIANNSFILAFHAPPSAVRKVRFSAICLDCLAGAPPPSPSASSGSG